MDHSPGQPGEYRKYSVSVSSKLSLLYYKLPSCGARIGIALKYSAPTFIVGVAVQYSDHSPLSTARGRERWTHDEIQVTVVVHVADGQGPA